ncbi:negative elongation factor C/D [Dendrobates tinctorius]|uniref:negative elongation factor C/D n=1 Tax=Dendrobates tinctorius TaxID=92724 RepID=UPI003CC96BC0
MATTLVLVNDQAFPPHSREQPLLGCTEALVQYSGSCPRSHTGGWSSQTWPPPPSRTDWFYYSFPLHFREQNTLSYCAWKLRKVNRGRTWRPPKLEKMDPEYFLGSSSGGGVSTGTIMGDWEERGADEEYGEAEDDAEVQQECLQKLSSRDYIMEPAIFNTLKRYFQAGGSPENVIQLLSENYAAVAQTVNLLAEWLIHSGVEPVQVQETVENHLKSLLIKHFEPRKADSIFTEEGETPAWLEQMIAHTTWRDLFYKLAEAHPDCLMLNFTVKLISDAGFQGEITSVSTACQQLEVFSRVLRTSLATILDGGEENLEKNLPEFAKMVCHGEHTYLFAQAIMSILAQEEQGGSAMRRIAQEVQRFAHEKGHDASQITLALGTAASYPRACQALGAMLSKGALNPADITVLYKMFTSMDSPPVELIRVPAFLDLFMQSLFKPGAKINQDHKHKYIHILAYAASVVETWKKNKRVNINKDELKSTSKAIETVHNLCCNENKGASELVAELGTLYQCIRFPVVAMGVLKWVDWTVSEPRYFQLQTDHTPVHLALLDEISTCHQLLHPQVLQLLIKLFETEHSQLDVMEQMELKKTLLDRMVHLLSRGYVLPVVTYIRRCLEKLDTDISLIRYFVTEVLDVIAPPYTSDFVQLFLPILENESIAGTIKTEGEHDPVTEFIAHCKSKFIMIN